MEEKIYPYLIEEQKMNEYYKFLIDNEYSIKIFDKNKDKGIYDLFLPQIRNNLFWTFSLTKDKKQFKDLSNGLKATVCKNYKCNIFEKKKTKIICFNNGICFAVSEDKNEVRKIKNHNARKEMQEINLRDEIAYDIPFELRSELKSSYLYLYILQLYKMVFMNKIQKEIQNPSSFNKVRNEFVIFIEQIYNIQATDNEDAMDLCERWEDLFDLERLHIRIDNEFDLIYKNNKLNDNIKVQRLCLLLFSVAIIIGIINLWGMIQ